MNGPERSAARPYRILVQGNHVADQLAHGIRLVAALAGPDEIFVRHVRRLGPDDPIEISVAPDLVAFARGCDAFVEQIEPGSSGAIADLVPAGAVRIRFPAARLPFLWPVATEPHPLNRSRPPHLPSGIYGRIAGDAMLNALLLRGVPRQAALDEFMKLDPVRQGKADEVFARAHARALAIEAGCDIRLVDFIEARFAAQPLFRTAEQPAWPLLEHLSRLVLAALPIGLPAVAIDVGLRRYQASGAAEQWQVPIHPAVAAHFGLRWHRPELRFRWDVEGWFTHREFLGRYIAFRFDEDLHRGRWHSQAPGGDPVEGERLLRCGLARDPGNAAVAFWMGLNLARRQRFDEALAFSDVAVSHDEGGLDHRAVANHAQILAKLGRVEPAILAWQRAIELFPGFGPYHFQVASLIRRRADPAGAATSFKLAAAFDPYVGRHHLAVAKHGGLPEAAREPHYRQALALDPVDGHSLAGYADALDRWGRRAEALEFARSIPAAARPGASDLAVYARVAANAGLPEEAVRALEARVALAPCDAAAQFDLAKARAALGRFDEALPAIEAAAATGLGRDPQALDLKADILAGLGRCRDAIEALREAVAVGGQEPLRMLALGSSHLRSGDPAAALPYLEKSAALAPHGMRQRLELARCLAALGRAADALPHCATVIAAEPGNGEARYLHALALLGAGRRARALDEAREAARLRPDHIDGHRLRGRLALMEGELAESEQAYRRALGLDESAARVWCQLGRVLHRAGRVAEALDATERAVALGPGEAEFQARAGTLLALLGRIGPAERALRRAAELAPGEAVHAYRLSEFYERTGRLSDSVAEAARAASLAPDNAGLALRPDRLRQFLVAQG
jgi:tetratricopeptide (TPR) repeat protein